MQSLIRFALSQRLFVLLMTAALVVAGLSALRNLPIEAFPDVQDVQVQVITQSAGQAPEEMERAITQPIEREMAGLPGLISVRSISMTGLSVVTTTFADGTDDYFARQQVMEKLTGVNLPPNVQPGLAPLSTAVGEVYRYILEAPALPPSEVRAIQDWVVRPTLRMTPGVADVNSFGGTIKEYQVEVDPHRLARMQVTLDQVNQALVNGSGNAGGGLLRRGDESFVVRNVGLFQSLDDIGHAVVASRQGRAITVADVADVHLGERPKYGIVAVDDKDSVVEGIVTMVKGGNPAKINADLKARIEKLQPQLPPGVKIVPIYDRTELVGHTVHTVTENLVIGALLVVTVLVLFLRSVRAAAVVASIIPLALLFAFILMHAKGVSANLISLGAVDFGIMIDSAVVLVEALMVRLAVQQAHHAQQAPYLSPVGHRISTLQRTASDLGQPILFSKAIIILAFVPIFTFQRVEGKIFTPVALTLSFALLGALILTLTWVPTLLAYALQRRDMPERHSPWMHALQHRYGALLRRCMRAPWRWIVPSVLLLTLSLVLAPRLGSEFLPKLDEGNIWLTLELPKSAALEATKDVERQVRQVLRGVPEVRHVITQAGRPDDGTDPKGPNSLEVLVDLRPRGEWQHADKESLVADMSARIHRIPGLETNFSQVIQDNVEEAMSGAKGEIVVKITGPDMAVLDQLGRQVADVVRAVPGATDVDAIRIGGQPELSIHPDRARLARWGLTINDVNTLINEALAGAAVNTMYEGDRRFDVTVRLAQPYRTAVDDISHLQLTLPNTQVGNGPATIALGDVADITLREGASRIQRELGARTMVVKTNLHHRDQGSFVEEAQAKVADAVHLPAGYHLTWGGQFENSQRAAERLRLIIPVTALLIFCLLFWAFRSVRLAGLTLAMVPFTMIGGLAALGIAGLHLSVSAAVGFIAVAGIAVQNGVIMVEEVIERVRGGAAVATAVVEGAVLRLRPILMTALMAGLGLMPAALSHGIGSETQRPFACVIVGGIVSGTFFTLLLLPLLLQRFARFEEPGERRTP